MVPSHSLTQFGLLSPTHAKKARAEDDRSEGPAKALWPFPRDTEVLIVGRRLQAWSDGLILRPLSSVKSLLSGSLHPTSRQGLRPSVGPLPDPAGIQRLDVALTFILDVETTMSIVLIGSLHPSSPM